MYKLLRLLIILGAFFLFGCKNGGGSAGEQALQNAVESGASEAELKNILCTFFDLFCSSTLLSEQAQNITVTAQDKSGNVYANLALNLWIKDFVADGNYISIATDDSGRFTVNDAINGAYTFTSKDPTSNLFLSHTIDAGEAYGNDINCSTGNNSHALILPRVLYADGQNAINFGNSFSNASIGNGSTDWFFSGFKFIAQAVKPSEALSVCGVGLGVGLGNLNAKPISIKIYSDDDGEPGAVLHEQAPNAHTGPTNGDISISSGGIAQYSDFCLEGSAVEFTADTIYWIVAEFSNAQTGSIGAGGSTAVPLSGIAPLQSDDGATWEAVNLQDGFYKSLNLFLVE